MFTAFIEVLKDLWMFATQPVVNKSTVNPPGASVQADDTAQSARHNALAVSMPQQSLESRTCYVQNKSVFCLQTPQKKFDTVRGVLKYGDSVRVLQQKNSWSFVEQSIIQGWVETTNLTEVEAEVFPQLQNNGVYDADNQETKKLRLCISDELLGGELQIVMQSTEYILYRLRRIGKNIHWPLERPRLPGMWQRILQDKKGVSIGLEPKTGSVLECSNGLETPFLAYVETVTPDEIITISSIGRSEKGKYEQVQYSKTQWQVWKPVFISFT